MPVCNTDLEKRLYAALRRISLYEKPERLRRSAQKQYGVDGDEVIEMAYENVLREARIGLRGVRLPTSKAK